MTVQFIDLYETIVKYYPIGIDALDPVYQDYHGIKSLQELKINKLKSNKFEEWKSFIERIKGDKANVLESSSESGLYDCCYSGNLLLKKERCNSMIYFQEICFHVSVLGPYYFVYGKDSIAVVNNGTQVNFEPIIFIAPIKHYEFWFEYIRKKIQDEFTEYHFIPYSLLAERVKSLSVGDVAGQPKCDASIFQAIFNNEDITRYKYDGNLLYK